MKILIISNLFEQISGGSEYQAYLYANELIKQGIEVIFLAYVRNGDNYLEIVRNIRVYHCAPPKWVQKTPVLRNGDIRYSSYRYFAYVLDKEKPDAILQIGESSLTGSFVKLGRARNIPFIWVCASDRSLWPHHFCWKAPLGYMGDLLTDYGIRNATRHFLQNQEQIDCFKKKFQDCEFGTFPNIQPVPDSLPVKDNPPLIVWVANLKPLNQPELFVKLAEDFAKQYNYKFVMMGRADENYIRQMESNSSRLPNFRFIGSQTQDDVNIWLEKASLLVNTSQFEGFSNTFVQAWLRKTPVITLNVNPSRVFDEHHIGACANNDFDRLCQLVKQFLSEPQQWNQYSEKAYEYAVNNHSIEKNFPTLLEAINSSIDSPRQ